MTLNFAIPVAAKLQNFLGVFLQFQIGVDNDALEFKTIDSEPVPETVVIDTDNFDRLVSYIRKMDDLYRAPLVLRVQGYKITEIAEILGLNPQTVKVRLHRARKIILSELEAESHGSKEG